MSPAPRRARWRARLGVVAVAASVVATGLPVVAASANEIAQPLPFTQDWTDTGLITANDDWSAVPGIVGYLGQDLTSSTGTDPQTITAGASAAANDVDVIANQTNPSISNGGVAEFELTNPTVALQGSGTADAPHLIATVDTSGSSSVNVSYRLRDLDGTADNAVQAVALQYRVGTSGSFTNVPAGYVPDATSGPSQANLVTPVSAALPAAAAGQPVVQVRIVTTNAVGNDEWVGVDDLVISQAVGPQLTCPSSLGTVAGSAASTTLIAVDADSRITGIAISSTPTAGISLTASNVPSGVSDTATATLQVSDTATAGTYPTTITATSEGDETTSCTVQVTVFRPVTIAQVQGPGATSPLLGQPVSVEGVVTGDFQEAGQYGGFFVQSLAPDADRRTSEGIRVLAGQGPAPVSVGDRVRVSGAVAEAASSSSLYTGTETQLPATSTVTLLGTAPLPAATPVALPFAATTGGVDGQERYEGMLVALADNGLVATDLFTLGRFGEVSLTTDELLRIPTTPEQDAANNRDRITLDDGLSGQNLTDLPYTVGGDGVTLPRAGDAPVDPVVGVLSYGFGEYRIEPPVGTDIDFERLNPRTAAPDPVGGDVQVASFNVLNYFVGFGGENRGADDQAELDRQRAKLVAAITALDADVVGLIEIANDGGAALTDLVQALNAAQPDTADDYAAVEAPDLTAPNALGGTYGGDAIRQAIIYRPSVVAPAGPPPSDARVLDPRDTAAGFTTEPVFDRPPAVQEFRTVSGGEGFTVLVNHFKSKGSTRPQCGTPDPFAGNCDDLRERQAAALVEVVQDLGATDDALLLGDFNAYQDEAPIAVLEAAGYLDAAERLAPSDRYSYSFDGEFGTLDYVFAAPGARDRLTGTDIWHINAPEAPAYDYNSFNQPALYAPDAFGSSDHDPVLVGLTAAPVALSDTYTLTLLHNNDGESSLLPGPGSGSGSANYLGGIARFGTLVQDLRAEAAGPDAGSLLVSSGDNYLAGPQLNASLENFDGAGDGYEDDGPFYDAVALDALGYDASAVGNHEFDFGPEVLGYFISQFDDSNVRFVSSNLDVTGEEALEQFVSAPPGEAGTLVEWTRTTSAGIPVAIVGATTPRLPSISSPGPDVEAREDVRAAVQQAIAEATADGTEVVVFISHLQNILEDEALIPTLSGVDIAVAGGGDELLANADDVLLPGDVRQRPYPVDVQDTDGRTVPIVTTSGSYGYVGRLIVTLTADGRVSAVDPDSGPVRNIVQASSPPADQRQPDASIKANVEDPVQAFITSLQNTVVAVTEPRLNGVTADVRTRETNLGSLFADALLRTAVLEAPGAFGATRPKVALQNSGGIRNNVVRGPNQGISRFDTYQIAAFQNFVGYTTAVSATKLETLLEHSVSAATGANGQLVAEGRFGQWSGLRFTYDPARTAQTVTRSSTGVVTITRAGDRVQDVFLTLGTPSTADDVPIVRGGVVLPDAPSVDLASNSFTVGQNGDNYPFNLAEGQFVNLPSTYQQSLEEYLRALGTVTAAQYPEGVLGRIVAVSGTAPSPSATPSATATPSPTGTATPSPTGTATPSPTGTATPSPTGTATPAPTGTATPAPTGTATPAPTGTATPRPTGSATPAPTGSPAPGDGPADVDRIAGNDRFETGIALSQEAFGADEAEAVVLARSDVFADALAGTPLAAEVDGPLLLTPSDEVDERVLAELERVLADGGTVHVLGGPVAISEAAAQQVRDAGFVVERHAGADRYETAVAIAEELGDPDTVLLATGLDFPDGLAAGVAAAQVGGAVLLTAGDVAPQATTAYLADAEGPVYAVGGPAARAVPTAEPIVGATRYATAVLLAQEFFDGPTSVGLVNGQVFADALSAGWLLAREGSPLLLSLVDDLPVATEDYLREQDVDTVRLVGGPDVLAPGTEQQVEDATD